MLFAVSCVVGTAAAVLACRMSHRTGILDRPGDRKVHEKSVAYLGGLGVTLTLLLGTALYAWIAPLDTLRNRAVVDAFVYGLVAIFLIGLWDDVAGIRPLPKLALQIAVAVGLWSAGVRIERINIGFGDPMELMANADGRVLLALLAAVPSLIVTIGWYAALMNSINLIDGLDGLAGGVALIAALALGITGLTNPQDGWLVPGVAIPFVLAGALVGFLVLNWHPAKMFLGDSGSLTIGYVLATASLAASTKAPALLALLVPMVALALPLFETSFSFLRRALRRQNPFKADRRHLHHRLIDAGLDQRRTVLVFLYATLYLGVNSVILAQFKSFLILINVVMIGIGLMMLIEYLKYFERKRESASGASEKPEADAGRR